MSLKAEILIKDDDIWDPFVTFNTSFLPNPANILLMNRYFSHSLVVLNLIYFWHYNVHVIETCVYWIKEFYLNVINFSGIFAYQSLLYFLLLLYVCSSASFSFHFQFCINSLFVTIIIYLHFDSMTHIIMAFVDKE